MTGIQSCMAQSETVHNERLPPVPCFDLLSGAEPNFSFGAERWRGTAAGFGIIFHQESKYHPWEKDRLTSARS